jgi:hypothetical protein
MYKQWRKRRKDALEEERWKAEKRDNDAWKIDMISVVRNYNNTPRMNTMDRFYSHCSQSSSEEEDLFLS